MMNAVKVQYTVKAEYVETQKANIRRVMDALQKIGNPNLRYSTFVLEDGKTFVHFAMRANEEAQALLSNLAEFQHCHQALGASGPEVPPKARKLKKSATQTWSFLPWGPLGKTATPPGEVMPAGLISTTLPFCRTRRTEPWSRLVV